MDFLSFIDLIALLGFVQKSFFVDVTELFVDRANVPQVENDGVFNICSNINERGQRRDERHPNFLVPNNYLLLFWQRI